MSEFDQSETARKLFTLDIREVFAQSRVVSKCGHRRHATIRLAGAHFHVELVRVQEEDLVQPYDEASEEVHDVFEDMQRFYEGSYECLHLPGHEGLWVMFIHPHCQ